MIQYEKVCRVFVSQFFLSNKYNQNTYIIYKPYCYSLLLNTVSYISRTGSIESFFGIRLWFMDTRYAAGKRERQQRTQYIFWCFPDQTQSIGMNVKRKQNRSQLLVSTARHYRQTKVCVHRPFYLQKIRLPFLIFFRYETRQLCKKGVNNCENKKTRNIKRIMVFLDTLYYFFIPYSLKAASFFMHACSSCQVYTFWLYEFEFFISSVWAACLPTPKTNLVSVSDVTLHKT